MKIDKYSAILGNTVGFHDMGGLTEHRPIASLPFGGKYRLIDFPLSNLANAGIRSVFGIFQNENISSVFDHIRSGLFINQYPNINIEIVNPSKQTR